MVSTPFSRVSRHMIGLLMLAGIIGVLVGTGALPGTTARVHAQATVTITLNVTMQIVGLDEQVMPNADQSVLP